jgi:hypothetical protein
VGLHIAQPGRRGALGGEGHHVRRDIGGDHRPRRPDPPGGSQGGIADAAGQVQFRSAPPQPARDAANGSPIPTTVGPVRRAAAPACR